MTNEQFIWNYFKQHTKWTDEGIAGLMGNLRAESGLLPGNLQNSYEGKLGYTDESYTAAVDQGSYTAFATDGAGYGLAQWTYGPRKKKLLAFARARGSSIGDLETQCAFCVKEMAEDYPGVNQTLNSTREVLEASNRVLFYYECPADQGKTVQNLRHGYALSIYNRNRGTSPQCSGAKEKLRAVITALEALAEEL